jgi:protein SCO1/2
MRRLRAIAARLACCAIGVGPGLAAPASAAQPVQASATAAPSTAAPEGSTRSATELMDVVMWQREPIGGPFRLVDAQGRVRRDTDFRGRLMLVYFGFTTCPDVCPTDLARITAALQSLGPDADQVVPVFVTLDPARDTRALLAQYAAAFDPRWVALGGSAQAVAQAADAYRVYWAKVPVPGALRYTIDHSSFIHLVGRDGRWIGFLPPNTPAERIATVLRSHLGATGR